MWRFIRKKAGPDYHRLKTMVKEVSSRIYESRILRPETEIMKGTPWSRMRGQNSVDKGILGDCWQWKTNGQCSRGDNCSFRHDINKRAKLTQPNPSPRSSTRQNEGHASRTRSPRGKSPSGSMFRWPWKMSSCGIFVIDNKIPSHLESNS